MTKVQRIANNPVFYKDTILNSLPFRILAEKYNASRGTLKKAKNHPDFQKTMREYKKEAIKIVKQKTYKMLHDITIILQKWLDQLKNQKKLTCMDMQNVIRFSKQLSEIYAEKTEIKADVIQHVEYILPPELEKLLLLEEKKIDN